MKAMFAIFCKKRIFQIVTGLAFSLNDEQNLLQTKQRFMSIWHVVSVHSLRLGKKFGFPSQANTAKAVIPDLFDLDMLSRISVFLV